jgi:hypothetical protein
MAEIHLSENVKKVVINNSMRPMGRATIGGDENGMMEINLKAGDYINTIIHENLHLKNPAMPHGAVYRESDKLEAKMSLPQAARLLMETHHRMVNPKYERQTMQTVCSKVVSTTMGRQSYKK